MWIINYFSIIIMAKVGQVELLARFQKTDIKNLKLLTPADKLQGLFNQASSQPENLKPAELDPNSVYIAPNTEMKKKKTNQQHHLKLGKQDSHPE